MEIIIIIAVLIGLIWWFFLRTPADVVTYVSNKVEAPTSSAPYKVPEPVETTPIPLVVESTPVAVQEVAEPEVVVTPVKKPRKPRAPKAVVAEKPAAKKAAPVKKAAAMKPAPKARTPRSKKV